MRCHEQVLNELRDPGFVYDELDVLKSRDAEIANELDFILMDDNWESEAPEQYAELLKLSRKLREGGKK